MLTGVLSAFGAIVLTTLVAWLTVRRQRSGRIDTTEAKTLWDESQQMRKELRDEVVALRKEVSALSKENKNLREAVAELSSQVTDLTKQLASRKGTDDATK